ncbi:MAG: GNAT family N-acetyltransferase [Pseudomonadota bacterium]
MITRDANPDDALALSRLHARCFERAWDAASFLNWIESEHHAVIVAKRGEALVGAPFGAIICQTAALDWDIVTVITDPAARRKGIAAQLLADLIERAKETNASITLDVAADNIAALSLYEDAGFKEVGRRRAYYATNNKRTDALVLKLTVPNAA